MKKAPRNYFIYTLIPKKQVLWCRQQHLIYLSMHSVALNLLAAVKSLPEDGIASSAARRMHLSHPPHDVASLEL